MHQIHIIFESDGGIGSIPVEAYVGYARAARRRAVLQTEASAGYPEGQARRFYDVRSIPLMDLKRNPSGGFIVEEA